MGNDKKIIEKPYAIATTAASDNCRSIIDVCAVDKRYDYNESPSQLHAIVSKSIMAKRISITRVLAKKSLAWARYSIENLPIKLTMGNMGILTIVLALIMPRAFTYIIIYPTFRLVFGTLYPAYASYKAVRTKNVKEYVKWMMYWIVFALFTCAETFTDVFFSFWFPFYYEIKIILVLWLLSPATKGSSILYRRFVHPALIRREAEIDDALARATEQGYTAVLHLGTKGVNYATTVLMQTAIKGGGGLVQQLKKSYSLSDLTGEKEDENRNTSAMQDETDMITEPRRRENPGRRGYSPRRTQSSCNRVDMFFSEVDVDVREPKTREPIASLNNIRSSDDISSGYSSGEALQSHRITPHTESLLRTSSVGARTRSSKPRSTTKKVPEDGEEEWENDLLSNSNQPPPPPSSLSFLSAQKTLELLLYLSQMHNYIPSNFPNARISEVIEKYPESQSHVSSSSSSVSDVTVRERIIDPSENIESLMKAQDNLPSKISQCENSLAEQHLNQFEHCSNSNVDVKKLTEEICQDKFNELRQLLNNAHEAVTNIVNSHDDNSNTKELREKTIDTTNCSEQQNVNFPMTTLSKIDGGFDDRAGKYHKKPAPRVPSLALSTSEEEIMEIAQEHQALKATLVIKTGTVTTFTNASNTKHVFVSNNNLSQSLRTKKKRSSKENLSRFLAIPKNLFNSAFHKNEKHMSNKIDNFNVNTSQTPESPLPTAKSCEINNDIDNFISKSNGTNNVNENNVDVEDSLLKASFPGDNSTTDSYVDFRTDNLDECNTIKNAESNSVEC